MINGCPPGREVERVANEIPDLLFMEPNQVIFWLLAGRIVWIPDTAVRELQAEGHKVSLLTSIILTLCRKM